MIRLAKIIHKGISNCSGSSLQVLCKSELKSLETSFVFGKEFWKDITLSPAGLTLLSLYWGMITLVKGIVMQSKYRKYWTFCWWCFLLHNMVNHSTIKNTQVVFHIMPL